MDLTCTVCQVIAGPLTPSHTERRCCSVTWVTDRPHGLLHHRMEMIQSNGHKPTTSILIGHEGSVCVCVLGEEGRFSGIEKTRKQEKDVAL